MGSTNRSKRRKLDLLLWLYGHNCFWCAGEMRTDNPDHHQSASIDELRPICRGGRRTLPNQVAAHRGCNMRRGASIAPHAAFERHHKILRDHGLWHGDNGASER